MEERLKCPVCGVHLDEFGYEKIVLPTGKVIEVYCHVWDLSLNECWNTR